MHNFERFLHIFWVLTKTYQHSKNPSFICTNSKKCVHKFHSLKNHDRLFKKMFSYLFFSQYFRIYLAFVLKFKIVRDFYLKCMIVHIYAKVDMVPKPFRYYWSRNVLKICKFVIKFREYLYTESTIIPANIFSPKNEENANFFSYTAAKWKLRPF